VWLVSAPDAQQVTLAAEIKNLGDRKANGIPVGVFLDSASGKRLDAGSLRVSLAGFESQTIQVSVENPGEGADLAVVVDPEQQVSELTRDDNVRMLYNLGRSIIPRIMMHDGYTGLAMANTSHQDRTEHMNPLRRRWPDPE